MMRIAKFHHSRLVRVQALRTLSKCVEALGLVVFGLALLSDLIDDMVLYFLDGTRQRRHLLLFFASQGWPSVFGGIDHGWMNA